MIVLRVLLTHSFPKRVADIISLHFTSLNLYLAYLASLPRYNGVSGVNVGHIQGEEFMTEDCHLPNVLHNVSSFGHHLNGQRKHEQYCDVMARDP